MYVPQISVLYFCLFLPGLYHSLILAVHVSVVLMSRDTPLPISPSSLTWTFDTSFFILFLLFLGGSSLLCVVAPSPTHIKIKITPALMKDAQLAIFMQSTIPSLKALTYQVVCPHHWITPEPASFS